MYSTLNFPFAIIISLKHFNNAMHCSNNSFTTENNESRPSVGPARSDKMFSNLKLKNVFRAVFILLTAKFFILIVFKKNSINNNFKLRMFSKNKRTDKSLAFSRKTEVLTYILYEIKSIGCR